jgi:hypothetical protein
MKMTLLLVLFSFSGMAALLCPEENVVSSDLLKVATSLSRGGWQLKSSKKGHMYLVSTKTETKQTLINFFGSQEIARSYLMPGHLERAHFNAGEAVMFKANNFSKEIALGLEDKETFANLNDLYKANITNKQRDLGYNCMFSSLQLMDGVVPALAHAQNKTDGKKSQVYLEDFKTELDKKYKNVTLNEAQFGKALITFGFNHVAVYLGHNDDGDIFVMSKNGNLIKPQIMNVKEFQDSADEYADYSYGKPRNVVLSNAHDDKENKNNRQGTGIYIKK